MPSRFDCLSLVSDIVSVFDPLQVEQLRRQYRLDPQQVRTMRNRLFKRFTTDQVALADFPADERLRLHPLRLYRRFDSELDGASKLLFRTETGMLIEAVILRIASGRTTLCVSSQIGCAAACDFCATGRMGMAKNLSVDEILDQVLQAGQLLAVERRRLSNIVFMGMGEPLHNEMNLLAAIERLTASDHFNRSPASILVSTVGIPDAMTRLVAQKPRIPLALSLHSVNQSVRESIMPLARRYHLDQLRQTLRYCNDVQGREVMLEYLMLRDVNDSLDDARSLAAWTAGLLVHVNLIPFNAVEDAPHLRGTQREQIDAFAELLKSAGVKTTIRYSLGRDIDAACGQLVRKENRGNRHRLPRLPTLPSTA